MRMPKPARFVDDYLSYLLGRAGHAVYVDFHRSVRAAGFSALEWRVLAQLAGSPGLTIGELARQVIAQQPTVTKLVQRMEKSGWVERTSDPGDARRTLVTETRKGREVVGGLLRAAKRHEAQILDPHSAGDVRALKKILRALVARYEHDRTATVDAPAAERPAKTSKH